MRSLLLRRFAARLCDTMVCIGLVFLMWHVLLLRQVDLSMFVLISLWCYYLLIEPVLLRVWGRSLGKWLMRLQVVNVTHGPRLSFKSACVRSALLLTVGQGLHIPPIMVVFNAVAAAQVAKLGTAYWDRVARTNVISTRTHPRFIFWFVGIGLFTMMVMFFWYV